MARIHPKRLPPGANKKLLSRNTGPFKVMKKLNSNESTHGLPSDLGISPTFNVTDLTFYRGYDNEEDSEEKIITLPDALPPKDIIDVLDDQLVSTRRGGFQKKICPWAKPAHLRCYMDSCYRLPARESGSL